MNRIHLEVRSGGIRRVALTLFGCAVAAMFLASASLAMASTPRSIDTRVTPVYPVIAKIARMEGPVEINVTVDPNGKVTDLKTLNGDPILAAAAKKALQQWKFAPSLVASNENVKVNFHFHP